MAGLHLGFIIGVLNICISTQEQYLKDFMLRFGFYFALRIYIVSTCLKLAFKNYYENSKTLWDYTSVM